MAWHPQENPKHEKNSKAMKEQLILDLMLACRVQFEGSMFRRVPLLKCVYYNVRDPNQFPELQFDKYI
jgi:hypothetical protein